MAKFAKGEVVLVPFPFSDLSDQKLRPALVLAIAEYQDIILCQITSKPYSSKTSIKINSKDFIKGSLPVVGYVRPDKIFTANSKIIKKRVGLLTDHSTKDILKRVVSLFAG